MTSHAIPRRLLVAGACVLALAGAVGAQTPPPPARPAVDPFYSSRLREGIAAFDGGDYPGAAASLRVACFGMLDAPPDLADCLVRLALAQAGAGDREGFAQTFRRLLEGEELLGLYSKAQLAPELRAAFEKRAAEWVPRGTLDDSPAFAHLAPAPAATSPDPSGRGGRRERRARAEAASAAPGVASETPPASTPTPTPQPPREPPQRAATAAGSSEDAAAESAPASRAPLPPADERLLGLVREELAAAKTAAAVERIYTTAAALAVRHPTDARVQHAAAEAAYRASRWREAVDHFRRGGDPGEEQPLLLFYLAVAQWESGDAEAAAATMVRTQGRLRPTEFVESYRRKILAPTPSREASR